MTWFLWCNIIPVLFTHLFVKVKQQLHFVPHDPSNNTFTCTLPIKMKWCERKGYLSLPGWDKPDVDVYLTFQHNTVTQNEVFWLPISSLDKYFQVKKGRFGRILIFYDSSTNSSSSCPVLSLFELKTQSKCLDMCVCLKSLEKLRANPKTLDKRIPYVRKQCLQIFITIITYTRPNISFFSPGKMVESSEFTGLNPVWTGLYLHQVPVLFCYSTRSLLWLYYSPDETCQGFLWEIIGCFTYYSFHQKKKRISDWCCLSYSVLFCAFHSNNFQVVKQKNGHSLHTQWQQFCCVLKLLLYFWFALNWNWTPCCEHSIIIWLYDANIPAYHWRDIKVKHDHRCPADKLSLRALVL